MVGGDAKKRHHPEDRLSTYPWLENPKKSRFGLPLKTKFITICPSFLPPHCQLENLLRGHSWSKTWQTSHQEAPSHPPSSIIPCSGHGQLPQLLHCLLPLFFQPSTITSIWLSSPVAGGDTGSPRRSCIHFASSLASSLDLLPNTVLSFHTSPTNRHYPIIDIVHHKLGEANSGVWIEEGAFKHQGVDLETGRDSVCLRRKEITDQPI